MLIVAEGNTQHLVTAMSSCIPFIPTKLGCYTTMEPRYKEALSQGEFVQGGTKYCGPVP